MFNVFYVSRNEACSCHPEYSTNILITNESFDTIQELAVKFANEQCDNDKEFDAIDFLCYCAEIKRGIFFHSYELVPDFIGINEEHDIEGMVVSASPVKIAAMKLRKEQKEKLEKELAAKKQQEEEIKRKKLREQQEKEEYERLRAKFGE